MISAAIIPTLGLLSLLSCSADPAGDGSALVRDSAGVVIVENRRAAWTEESRWRLSDQPLLVLGESTGDPDRQLRQVHGLARLADGRIVVLNAGSGELRFFDASGGLVAKAGRLGGGPGEFESPLSLDLLGRDTLVVLDRMGDRLFFGPEGEFLREESMDPGRWLSFWRPRFGASFHGVLPDRSLLASLTEQAEPGADPDGLHRPVEGLAIARSDLSDTTHVAWFGGIQQQATRFGSSSPTTPPASSGSTA